MQITLSNQEMLDALTEVRIAISKVNRGGVVFNPAATDMLDEVIASLIGEAA